MSALDCDPRACLLAADGSNIDTYEGGYSQNLYLARNSYRFSFGGDREMMTLDTLNAYYFGPTKASSGGGVSPPTVTLSPCTARLDDNDGDSSVATPCAMTTSGQQVEGGAVAVQNGTGAGQVRRIVAWPNVSHNPTIVLDRAFDPPLDETSFVTVSPYWVGAMSKPYCLDWMCRPCRLADRKVLRRPFTLRLRLFRHWTHFL